jgi:acetyl esterase/lipase
VGTEKALPTIVSVHGGGWFYGSKELYSHYCTRLARRGFAVVNFDYRLAPEHKYPAPVEDTCQVLRWMQDNAENYHIDLNNVFLVGDSAGGQLVSQYAAILTNPSYMETFGMKPLLPGIGIRAVGLNCGLYDMKTVASHHRQGLELDYLGKEIANEDPRLDVLGAITENYPPAHITTACHDFLRPMAQPMHDFLAEKGIECALEVYGTEEDASVGHVFHVNILKPEAVRCNDAQCEFFKRYL